MSSTQVVIRGIGIGKALYIVGNCYRLPASDQYVFCSSDKCSMSASLCTILLQRIGHVGKNTFINFRWRFTENLLLSI